MNLILIGSGKMGRVCADTAAKQGHNIVDVFDKTKIDKLVKAPSCDAVIDFSQPEALPFVLNYMQNSGTAYVCGTTGLTASEVGLLKEIATVSPVIAESNFSLGYHAFCRAVNLAHSSLKEEFDTEIAEIHHATKKDKPGGSAASLAKSVHLDPLQVHAMRGGDVNGVHTVFFLGTGEYLQFTHTAQSKKIFALGALKAAEWLQGKDAGQYRFYNCMEEINEPS